MYVYNHLRADVNINGRRGWRSGKSDEKGRAKDSAVE